MTDSDKDPTPTAPAAMPIPKDLEDQVAAVRAIATAYNLLQKAAFPVSHANAVNASLSFLGALHGEALSKARAHPDADKCAELKEVA